MKNHLLKYILLPGLIIFSLIPFNSLAQCNINIDTAYYNGVGFAGPDTIKICEGDGVSFISNGGCPTYMMNNDFNSGSIGTGWQSNASPMLNNPCGAGIDGSTYCWIGPASSFPRELVTIGYNVTTSCQICFDMMYASQANSTPCEGPDEPTEGVHLQYSTVGATGPWLDINYWDPLGGYDPTLTSWNNYCENVPVNGMVWFRWYQTNTSGNDFDHWGLDNVQIFCPPPSQTVTWSDGTSTISTNFNTPVQYPTTNTNYTVTVSDGTLSATDQVYVDVHPTPTLTISGLNPTYCVNAAPVVLTGSPVPGVFSGPGITGTTFTPATAGVGTHTITYHNYYITSNTTTGPQTVWSDDFSIDKGWTGYGAGGWTRGSAIASSGCSGNQDPSTDHTPSADNFIIGNYLGSCYPNSMAATYWLTSPVINCANMNTCQIEFWSFSGCESPSWDHMYIDVSSNNGASWTNVYSNAASVSESAWTLRNYTTPQANNCATFKVRIGMGVTDGSVTYSGWNIDDFTVKCTGTLTVVDTLCDFTIDQNVTVFNQPSSAFSIIDSICLNSTSTFTYQGTSPATAAYNWNFDGGNIISGSGQGPYVVEYTTAGTHNISLSVTDGGCTSSPTVIPLTVLPMGDPNCCILPSTNAGPDGTTCLLTYNMQAIPSLGTGTWTQFAGPGTSIFSNANSPTSTVTVSVAGTYTFQWLENNGAGCTGSDQVDVTFIAQPVANAGPDDQACSLTYTMAAAPSVGTGTWTMVSGPGTATFTNNSSATSSVSVSLQGTYVFSWTEDNNGCLNTDNVTVNFAVQPVAQAGADNSVCLLSYQLQAIPSVGTGTWTSTGPGTATFVNANNPTTNVTVTTGGIYTFTWTENNGLGCISSDGVNITFTQQPVANAGPDISVCQLGTTLQGVASVGTGTWTQVTGPGTISFTDANSAATAITGSVQGTYTLQWAENNGNGCTSNDQMTVVLTQQPVANAGTDGAICSLTYTMTATPSAGTGTWLGISGPGTSMFAGINSPTSSVTVSQYGQYAFVWNENNGNGCFSNDTVTVTFNNIPTSTFDFTEILCFGNNSQITYTGDALSSATYLWNFGTATVISGSGQGPYVINYPSTGSFPVTLQVTQNNCVSITTTENPTSPAVLTLSLTKTDVSCFGANNGNIVSSVGGGILPYNYLWSDGSIFSMIPSASAGTYVLTVTDENGCQISDTTILYEPPQLAIDVPDYIPICNDSVITIDASATGGTFPYTYSWNSGYFTPSITVSPDTTTHYIVTATDAFGCTSVSNIEVYVYPPITFSAFSDVDSLCLGEKMIISTVVSGGDGGPYLYTINGSAGSAPFILYPNTSQSYQIIVKDGCQYSAMDTVPIVVYPNPPINFSSDITSGCIPLTIQFNESSPNEGQTYLWEFGDNEAAFVKNPSHTFKQPGTFSVNLTVTNIYGCKVSNLFSDFITAYPLPHAQFEANPPIAEIIKPIISFTNFSSLTDSVMWYFGDGDSSNVYNPTHQYQAYPSGIYDVTLVVISPLGCRDTVRGQVEVKDVFTFYAPTAFSPDNDGKNEVFIVSGSGIKEDTFHMLVYDRWGEVIFETTDINQGWDGRVKGGNKATVGTYTWLATFRDFKKVLHEKSGSVTILR